MSTGYPYLPLQNLSIDAALARRLPRRLAYYHLALPLAQDADEISVVMAHPERNNVITMLEMVLNARIVPVQGSGAEIKTALDNVWLQEPEAVNPRILSWGTSPEQATLAKASADIVALPFSAEVTDASQSTLETALMLAQEGQYSLLVMDAPQGQQLSYLLRKAPTPLLLLRGEIPTTNRILLVLRGYSPDESALNWVIPLAKANQSLVTLLAVNAPAVSSPIRELRVRHSLAKLLDPDTGQGRHIAACTRRLTEANLQGSLKLCQGTLENEIVTEFIRGDYGLLVIAAEVYGDFIQQVLIQLETQAASKSHPVLIVKPIAEQPRLE
jgi:hypothetical protein